MAPIPITTTSARRTDPGRRRAMPAADVARRGWSPRPRPAAASHTTAPLTAKTSAAVTLAHGRQDVLRPVGALRIRVVDQPERRHQHDALRGAEVAAVDADQAGPRPDPARVPGPVRRHRAGEHRLHARPARSPGRPATARRDVNTRLGSATTRVAPSAAPTTVARIGRRSRVMRSRSSARYAHADMNEPGDRPAVLVPLAATGGMPGREERGVDDEGAAARRRR